MDPAPGLPPQHRGLRAGQSGPAPTERLLPFVLGWTLLGGCAQNLPPAGFHVIDSKSRKNVGLTSGRGLLGGTAAAPPPPPAVSQGSRAGGRWPPGRLPPQPLSPRHPAAFCVCTRAVSERQRFLSPCLSTPHFLYRVLCGEGPSVALSASPSACPRLPPPRWWQGCACAGTAARRCPISISLLSF